MVQTGLHRARMLPPRLSGDVVARPRLVARLSAGLERPLILVAAPAGYGKTTLLCQWLDAAPARAAWLSLAARDSDLAGFVAAVVGALRALWPEVGRDLLGLLNLPVTPSPDYLGEALADALLGLPEPTILALDDYHTVGDPSVHAFVAALLEHPAPDFHLALATRLDPPLPLPRLRARDRVTELRGRDLAFSVDEARAFLTQAAGMPVSREDAARMDQQTEGWAAGLRLAALALREEGGPLGLARGFGGRRQRHALDFLLTEVLARLPADLEGFLLRTAVAERVCGPLCEALLDPPPPPGRGTATLQRLVEADLFTVALGEDEDGLAWVRYHPLFRGVLHERLLEREGAVAMADLYGRAAAWLAAHGLIDEAIDALLAGGDEDGAARLVEGRVIAMTEEVDWLTLRGWLRRLPDALVRRRPGLLLAHANVDHWRGQLVSLHERLRAATALLDAADPPLPPEEAATFRAQADDLTALTCLYQGDSAGVVEAARRALPHVPDKESFLGGSVRMMLGLGLHQLGRRDEALHALGATAYAGGEPTPRELFTLALIHLTEGDLPAARRWAARLLAIAERRDLPLLHGWAHYFLGRVAYELDELDEAREQFAAAAAEPRSNFFSNSEALLGLALTDQALGQSARSERLLTDLDELLAETGNDESRPRVNACQARLALQRDDRDRAIRWLESGRPSRVDILLYMECPSVTEARALLARGRPGDAAAAAALLAVFRARAEREHATIWVVQALAVEALAERARGDSTAALDCLASALVLAEPGGLARTFLDLGPPLAALLRGLAARRPPSPYLARLLAAIDKAGPDAPRPAPMAPQSPAADPALVLLGKLTEREAQMLEYLARHLTRKEIAEALSISPMTVKRHVSNLFDKLGVGSRREAVVLATALGLLPPADA